MSTPPPGQPVAEEASFMSYDDSFEADVSPTGTQASTAHAAVATAADAAEHAGSMGADTSPVPQYSPISSRKLPLKSPVPLPGTSPAPVPSDNADSTAPVTPATEAGMPTTLFPEDQAHASPAAVPVPEALVHADGTPHGVSGEEEEEVVMRPASPKAPSRPSRKHGSSRPSQRGRLLKKYTKGRGGATNVQPSPLAQSQVVPQPHKPASAKESSVRQAVATNGHAKGDKATTTSRRKSKHLSPRQQHAQERLMSAYSAAAGEEKVAAESRSAIDLHNGGTTKAHVPAPSPLRTTDSNTKAQRKRRRAAVRREKVLNSTPYAAPRPTIPTPWRPNPPSKSTTSASRKPHPEHPPAMVPAESTLHVAKDELMQASKDPAAFQEQLREMQQQLQDSLHTPVSEAQAPAAGAQSSTATGTAAATASQRGSQGNEAHVHRRKRPRRRGGKSRPAGATNTSHASAPGTQRRNSTESAARVTITQIHGPATAQRHTPRDSTLPSARREPSSSSVAVRSAREREGRSRRREKSRSTMADREAGWMQYEKPLPSDSQQHRQSRPSPNRNRSLEFLGRHHFSLTDGSPRLPSHAVQRSPSTEGGQHADPTVQVTTMYESKLASLTARHAARVAVMNNRIKKLEKALASSDKEAEKGRVQLKRQRQRVAELQDLLSRVMPEREEAIAKVNTLTKQYDKEIRALQGSMRKHHAQMEASRARQSEADRVTGKLLVHLEGDLANIADATPRRVASKPSAGSSNLRELRREQRMLQQQDALHRLEWEINRKQAQMTRLRKDQEAALVDLRVQLNGGFHAKEVAWARERANLSGQIQRLQAEIRQNGAKPQASGAQAPVPDAGARTGAATPLPPLTEGEITAPAAAAQLGVPSQPVEYRPASGPRDKSRADIKSMRRSLGAAQTVFRGGHNLGTKYVVVSMLWRNTARRRLAISAREPETNIERTITCGDDVLSRRFEFDVLRSVRCLPSLPAARQTQVCLAILQRLELVEEDESPWSMRLMRKDLPAGAVGSASDETLHAATTTLMSGHSAHVHVQWSPDPAERLQATAQETSGNFQITATFDDARLKAILGVDPSNLALRRTSSVAAKKLVNHLAVAALASNGALTLCMLPKSASKLAGKVLVRIVHGSAGSKGVYLAVSTDAEHKCLRFQSINLANGHVNTLRVSNAETSPWRRTALGRQAVGPITSLPTHEQAQVAMYAVAKLQFGSDGEMVLRASAEPVEEGFVPPWEKLQPVMERGLKIGSVYAIVRLHWSVDHTHRLQLVCHNPINSSEGVLALSDLQLQLTLQVDAKVLVSTKQRLAVAERLIRCLRWDGRGGRVTLAL